MDVIQEQARLQEIRVHITVLSQEMSLKKLYFGPKPKAQKAKPYMEPENCYNYVTKMVTSEK